MKNVPVATFFQVMMLCFLYAFVFAHFTVVLKGNVQKPIDITLASLCYVSASPNHCVLEINHPKSGTKKIINKIVYCI